MQTVKHNDLEKSYHLKKQYENLVHIIWNSTSFASRLDFISRVWLKREHPETVFPQRSDQVRIIAKKLRMNEEVESAEAKKIRNWLDGKGKTCDTGLLLGLSLASYGFNIFALMEDFGKYAKRDFLKEAGL